jgi:hypothetical protein
MLLEEADDLVCHDLLHKALGLNVLAVVPAAIDK